MLGELTFSAIDWAIVAAYILFTVVLGFWANRYIRDMNDYVVAGRTLRTSLGVATMLGSEIGLITIMYMSQQGFTSGFAAFNVGLLAGIGCFLIGATGFIVGPLRAAGVKTIPEYYERRFGKGVRILGGSIMAVAGILNMGLFLHVGAEFMGGIAGVNDVTTIRYLMGGLLVLVLLYTTLGGMVSVVITDYVQFVVLSVGLIACCLIAVQAVGWDVITDDARVIHQEAGLDPFQAEGGPLNWLWNFLAFGLVACAIWPTAVMRACSAKDEQTVKSLYRWSAIGFAIRSILPMFLGICALAYMFESDALKSTFFAPDGSPIPDKSLEATPVFLGQILPVGLLGLIAAAMLAAFMSTNDSYLLCWAVVVVEDVIGPCWSSPLETKTKLLLSRIFIVSIGLFLLFFGLVYPLHEDAWKYLAITGAIYFTGAIALLIFGLYWKQASKLGAYLALGAGCFAILGIEPIRTQLFPEGVQEYHVGFATVFLSVIAMVVGSILSPDRRLHPKAQVSNPYEEYEPVQLESWK